MKQMPHTGQRRTKTKKGTSYGIYFLGCVVCIYLILFFIHPGNMEKSLKASMHIFLQVCPALVVVILLMGLMNYLVDPKTVSRYVGEGSGIKGWLLAISTGILSHGPIYAWYPLLRDLRRQGMKVGLVAVFLYNRAIKIPLLPVMVYYFGMPLVIVLSVYMMLASLVQGQLVQMVERSVSQ